MKDVSPATRAAAGMVADLFSLAILGLAVFGWIDRNAPPQDLAWKPLKIEHRIGLATTAKLEWILADPARCTAFLRREAVAFDPAADRREGEFCVVEDAGMVGPQPMRLSPARPMMTCRLTAAFAIWTRQSVAPAARDVLGSDVVQIDHLGTYACRRVYGREAGRVSQHAYAQAVDVAAVRLSDGRRIDVRSGWTGSPSEAAFLHRIRDEGCRLFRVALSPDYNSAHADHLHFDMSPYRLCR